MFKITGKVTYQVMIETTGIIPGIMVLPFVSTRIFTLTRGFYKTQCIHFRFLIDIGMIYIIQHKFCQF